MANQLWDVVVIGGGPAGMMAAGRAAEKGAKVLLLEKNSDLGRKLLLTGGGRCNLTNAESDQQKFLSKYGPAGKFLFSAFARFGVKDTLAFFKHQGVETKIEPGDRVFPVSDRSQTILNSLTDYLKAGGVEIRVEAVVASFVSQTGRIEAIKLTTGQEIRARSFVLATGGKSHRETGSTGDGFIWLKTLGHKVIEPSAALVPVAIREAWVKQLSGLALEKAKLTIFIDGVKQKAKTGKILFTHFGLSGPLVLNLSREIGQWKKEGEVTLLLDVLPALGYDQLNTKLQEIFKTDSNKKLKNSLGSLVPEALIETILTMSEIKSDVFCHSVTKEERNRLVKIFKSLPMTVDRILGLDTAIVTSGGVDLTEVDFKTMRSHLFSNLYLVGDVLDIDRPSGGFSLQLCWTTGYLAGDSVV
ncbi:MAG: NAD(P)/FAD-dependent oxidoreductase [Candidatus Paceibacterota bacterium]|jgi:hypothetical protein